MSAIAIVAIIKEEDILLLHSLKVVSDFEHDDFTIV